MLCAIGTASRIGYRQAFLLAAVGAGARLMAWGGGSKVYRRSPVDRPVRRIFSGSTSETGGRVSVEVPIDAMQTGKTAFLNPCQASVQCDFDMGRQT